MFLNWFRFISFQTIFTIPFTQIKFNSLLNYVLPLSNSWICGQRNKKKKKTPLSFGDPDGNPSYYPLRIRLKSGFLRSFLATTLTRKERHSAKDFIE